MRVVALIFGLLAFASLAPAVAADEGKKSDSEPGSSVEMPYLIAPLSSDGQLLGYAYISCKIIGTSPATALAIRDKVPFIQDAFVRDVNAVSIAKPGSPGEVDQTVLAARLLALVKKVVGAGKVTDLKLTQVQITAPKPGAIPAAAPSSGPS